MFVVAEPLPEYLCLIMVRCHVIGEVDGSNESTCLLSTDISLSGQLESENLLYAPAVKLTDRHSLSRMLSSQVNMLTMIEVRSPRIRNIEAEC